jgi:hypothetical protein
MYNEQWPGHGQQETAEIFRELVELMPEAPLSKIGHFASAGLRKLGNIANQGLSQNDATPVIPLHEQRDGALRRS